MQTHNKIKIIKRVERVLRQEQTDAAREPEDGERPTLTVRAAVTTVTGWISELRQKKDQEVAAARVLLSSLSKA